MLKKIVLLTFVVGLFLCGCSNKQKSSEEANSREKDLFVEYNGGYFPENYQSVRTIRTLRTAKKRTTEKYRSKNSDSYREQFFTWQNRNAGREASGARYQLLRAARSAIGTPYVVGGTSPGGFDCSGLVCWAYGNVGVKLPRTAREQSVVGRRICSIADMREGDIVAFHHPKRGYHTGIYVGDGKFIHSPRRRTRVKINSLADPYFNATFLGARRINLTGREDLLAQAERNLKNDYSYANNSRRFNVEEVRTSRNAGHYRHHRNHRHFSKRELAELKRGKHKSRDREEYSNHRSSRKSRMMASAEKRKGSKYDREEKRSAKNDRRHNKKEEASKSDKRSKAKQVTAYDSKHDKKHSKSDKKKKSSRKS